MKLLLVAVGHASKPPTSPCTTLAREYTERSSRFAECSLQSVRNEAGLLARVDKGVGRTRAILILADSSGKQVTSQELAESVRRLRDSGVQQVIFAVGPADGWSGDTLARADMTIAFGRITLPHELALVILAEQVYRALTILAGHPYHTGH